MPVHFKYILRGEVLCLDTTARHQTGAGPFVMTSAGINGYCYLLILHHLMFLYLSKCLTDIGKQERASNPCLVLVSLLFVLVT